MFTSWLSWLLPVQLAFAGATKYVEHWGFFGIVAALCIAGGMFSSMIPGIGPYLTALRKDLYWTAFGCGLIMLGMFIGGRDGDNRCEAKGNVISTTVETAVDRTKMPAAQHQKDRWDRPEY